MNENIPLERYHLKNLDCASCASKIEHGLNQIDIVEEAVIDFANLTLHIKTGDMAPVIETAQRIDPKVEIVPISPAGKLSGQDADSYGVNLKKELALLITAGLLFSLLPLAQWLTPALSMAPWWIVIVLSAYLLAGWNVLKGALRTIIRGTFFDENVLMAIATIGAIAIHAWSEAVGVMIFYKTGELLQELAVARSRRSIRALLAAKPDRAVLKTESGYREVSPEAVKVGDLIAVKPGEKIPLDGEVVAGSSQVDTSALTGESVPLTARPGDGVMAGQINKTSALTIEVSRPFEESSIARVMEMVESATARKARTEKFITTFARYYTPAVVLIAAVIAFGPPLFVGADFKFWVYRALVILVISCPCALVVSIPLGYFGGIGRASRDGILVKGSNFLDALAKVKTVVFDKTGTLTQGVFHVTEIVNLNSYSRDQLLQLAAAAESQSSHPIATSILAAFQENGGKLDFTKITDHQDMSGQGVAAHYGGHQIMVGNDSLLHMQAIPHPKCEFESTVAHIVVDGHYAGYIAIGDQIRPETADAITALRDLGVDHVAMLTGDNSFAAKAVGQKLRLDGVHADLLPEDKVRIFEKISVRNAPGEKTVFVGDGINDAPVIARADIGIAMGGLGSDAAVETADVVLMTDSPSKVAAAISVARQTRRIVWQNITLAFAVKGVFIVFGAMGMASMWEAVFADMGTALLAVANATRMLGKRSSDIAVSPG